MSKLEIPDKTAPRLSWNRPPFDPDFYQGGKTLFRLDKTAPVPGGRSVDDKHIYKRTLSIIDERFTDPSFSLKDIANESGFCVRQIQRILKKNGSPGFQVEVRRRRVSLACQKLQARDEKPLSSIAIECGYRQSGFFSQVFVQDVGMGPQAYRSEMLGKVNCHETADV